ncbi:hypothetical protein C9374_009110 [Naegleria lovaniensis]|uniref:PLD phosphodiesterase domain-containing protein n=1 Tax=Naegleria lovaniensis TaxID=51637 RepID=A0AA88KK86_NAELO|nr:uncharacterized protein C9374_009110 [Naegleria lovaniensis]KAG2377594.1 hypothetical protein C9374_009110 [Naegleria lovaniensis]
MFKASTTALTRGSSSLVYSSYYRNLFYSRVWHRFMFKSKSWIWRHGGVAKATEEVISAFYPHLEELSKKCGRDLLLPWFMSISQSISLGGFSENNRVKEIYFHGADYFKSLWNHIDRAKKRVFIDCYTISTDQTGDKTLVKLIEAAHRGVEVILTVDAFGSYHIDFEKEDLIQELKDAGGKVLKFNEKDLKLIYFFLRHPSRSPTLRNHKKVCVIDDKIGLIGGMNIENRYSNPFDRQMYTEEQLEREITAEEGDRGVLDVPPDENLLDELDEYIEKGRSNTTDFNVLLSGIGDMRDLHCMVDGPCVSYLTLSLLFSLEQSNSKYGKALALNFPKEDICTADREFEPESLQDFIEEADVPKDINRMEFSKQATTAQQTSSNSMSEERRFSQVLFSDPKKHKTALYKNICNVIKNSTSHCYISTPYFYPPERLREALITARKNGCDVRLLTCGRSDVPGMRYISTYIYEDYLKHGIRVYEYFGKTLHAKYMTIDGFFTSMGSYNLDKMSLETNLEVGIQHYDIKLAKELEKDFKRELEVSKEILLEDWERRPFKLKMMGFIWYWIYELFGPEGKLTFKKWVFNSHK